MPEGDTIYRTATSLRRWLGGRRITAADARGAGLDASALVGRVVDAVDSRGKHLLVRLSGGLVLHTHMRMTGSWHVYPTGEPWRKPARQARVVLEAGSHLAVCFNAPVVELLDRRAEGRHPALSGLGPDVLAAGSLDLASVVSRARAWSASAGPGSLGSASVGPRSVGSGSVGSVGSGSVGSVGSGSVGSGSVGSVGELLLDQRFVAGIGNIYRCESLFLCRVHPATPVPDLADTTLEALVTVASRLMYRNATAGSAFDRSFDGPTAEPWVYRRAGLGCRRCGTVVRRALLGHQARAVYWCPTCQPRPGPPPAA